MYIVTKKQVYIILSNIHNYDVINLFGTPFFKNHILSFPEDIDHLPYPGRIPREFMTSITTPRLNWDHSLFSFWLMYSS